MATTSFVVVYLQEYKIERFLYRLLIQVLRYFVGILRIEG